MRAIESELSDGRRLSWQASGPVYLAGHSLGEYTALVAAGALSFADGLRLVRERGRLMKEAGIRSPGLMAAILGLEEQQVATVCAEVTAKAGIVQVANDNCPGQVVISGDRQGMEAAMDALSKAGTRKVVPLAISIASHSPLMQPAAEQLRSVLLAAPIETPQVAVIGNTTARLLTNRDEIRSELMSQLTGSVRWTASMQLAIADGVCDFVEVGPGDVLVGLVKRVDRKAGRHSVSDPEGVKTFVKWLVADKN